MRVHVFSLSVEENTTHEKTCELHEYFPDNAEEEERVRIELEANGHCRSGDKLFEAADRAV